MRLRGESNIAWPILVGVCVSSLLMGSCDSGADAGDSSESSTEGSTAVGQGAGNSATSDGAEEQAETDPGTDSGSIGNTDSGTTDNTDDPQEDEAQAADGPALAPFSGESCPDLAAGSSTFTSSGLNREVLITLPTEPSGAGVVFLWHGFGDTADNFSMAVGASGIGSSFDVITVTPAAAIDPMETEKLAEYRDLATSIGIPMPPVWSILGDPEIDLTLFEDILACLNEQYGIDTQRIYTMGFSQGALWSTVLLMERAEILASALLWSGGLGSNDGMIEVVWNEYKTPARKIPVLAAAGGSTDSWPGAMALVDFQSGSELLVESLVADGHTAIYCNHDLGHTIPPDGFQWGLDFLFSHSWSEDGASAYAEHDGSGFPDYCVFP